MVLPEWDMQAILTTGLAEAICFTNFTRKSSLLHMTYMSACITVHIQMPIRTSCWQSPDLNTWYTQLTCQDAMP